MGGGERTFAICRSCDRFHVAEILEDGRIMTVGRKRCPCGETDLEPIDATDLERP